MIKIDEMQKQSYWSGNKNKAIRYYYYAKKGLELMNEFRYLIMAVFAMYYALRINNILLIPIMFITALPILIFLGWMSVHHMQKVMEWINIKFSTYWSMYTYELYEKQVTLLEDIKDAIKNNKEGKQRKAL